VVADEEATTADAASRSPAAPIDLSETLVQSGLVMIETNRDKVEAFRTQTEEPAPRLGRRPRPVQPVSNEPLQQVETVRKD
jgi:ribonuclease E